MTPRECWRAMINHEPADRIPTDIWATDEFWAKLIKHLGVADQWEARHQLKIDYPIGLGMTVKPQRMALFEDGCDFFGVPYRRVDYGSGAYSEVARHPLAGATTVREIHDYPWPTVDDIDFTPAERTMREEDGTRSMNVGQFPAHMIYGNLRGLELAFEDLLVEPDIAHAIFEHLFEYYYETNKRLLEIGQGRVDWLHLNDDLGGQHGPLFSLELYREFLLPNQKRMGELARAYGAAVFFHTDGSSDAFLPDLVNEVGVKILNPIQWRCPGMEREKLAADWGDKLVFHGAIDNQQTLPFGSTEDVAAEVRETSEIFRDCSWICAPCHNIQAVSPPENAVAMYETIAAINAERSRA